MNEADNMNTPADLLDLGFSEIDEHKSKYMTFKSGNEYFGLKIQYVNEIIQIQAITMVPETEEYIKGLINLWGKIVPVIDVRLRFGQDAFEYNDRTCIIVIQVNTMMVGLIVEKIADVVEIKDSDILPPPTISRADQGNRKYIYGIGKVGDSVKLLLDPDKLLSDQDMAAVENKLIEEE